MRSIIGSAQRARQYLRKHTLATMDQLKAVLRTRVDMTVFRKLHALGYRTSYSHRRRYYTLNEITHFDQRGLWSCRGVRFSKFGTLVQTLLHLVQQSPQGYTASALRKQLFVEVKTPLLHLVRQQHLAREKVAAGYVYLSVDPVRRRQQVLSCREQPPVKLQEMATGDAGILAHELKAALILFVSLLDEQQRRLWAGLESLRLGYGGDQTIAALLGIDPHTVARGRQQLLQRDVNPQRVRDRGAGRPDIKKNTANR